MRFDPDVYPGSTYLTVTRTGTDSWIVEATPAHVAELVSDDGSRREGYFRMPFRITVTR